MMIRTKTGCVTCRIRRVKCDETKPNCNKCTSTGRKCDGYASHRLRLPRRDSPPLDQGKKPGRSENKVTPVILPAPICLSLQLFRDEDESRSFDFFRSNSVPQTNRLVDSAFWSRLVLQVATEEPAIKSGVLSLGALQRDYELRQGEDKSLAISRYTHAVHDAQDLVQRAQVSGDYTKVLVCALLFHCVENALGDHVAAKTHLRSGLRLAYDHGFRNKHIGQMILSTYRRFDFQSMTFWDKSAPYEFSSETRRLLETTPQPRPFSSLNDAANTLMDLMHWLFYIHGQWDGRSRPLPLNPSHCALQLAQCRSYIESWSDHFEEYKAKHGTYLADFRQKCALLSIYYQLVKVHSRHLPPDPETQWDTSEPDFIQLLDLAESFGAEDTAAYSRGVLSFEMGVVLPLFETAMRCRNPYQRRRAITMLRSTPRREGVWDSLGAAAVAENAVSVEEEGLRKVENSSDVPESSRIHFLDPAADLSKREVHVTFFRQPQLTKAADGGEYFEWNTRQQSIRF